MEILIKNLTYLNIKDYKMCIFDHLSQPPTSLLLVPSNSSELININLQYFRSKILNEPKYLHKMLVTSQQKLSESLRTVLEL